MSIVQNFEQDLDITSFGLWVYTWCLENVKPTTACNSWYRGTCEERGCIRLKVEREWSTGRGKRRRGERKEKAAEEKGDAGREREEEERVRGRRKGERRGE